MKQTQCPNTLMCILSYLGIFALISYFTRRDDAFINWHSRQGLLITAVAILIVFLLGIMSMIPAIGMIATLANAVFSVAFILLSIFCIIQACHGRRWSVPGMDILLRRS